MMYFKTTIPVYILIISVNTMYLRMTKCFFEDDLHLEPCCQYAFYRMKQFLPGDKVCSISLLKNILKSQFCRAIIPAIGAKNWNKFD